MDLEFSASERRFRAEVQDFLRESLPASLSAKVLGLKRLTREDLLSWHRILYEKGWSAPSWPREFGGPGWSAVEQHIFDEECALAGAPPIISFGVRMVAPVIMQFGSREQQEFFHARTGCNSRTITRAVSSARPAGAPWSCPPSGSGN